jgi:hypothetical protein
MDNNITSTNSLEKTHDITPEEVRQFDRFKNYSDEQVHELIETIKTYTHFIYSICSKQKRSGDILSQLENSSSKPNVTTHERKYRRVCPDRV